MTPSLAVIVPAYNEVDCVEPFYARARLVLERVPADWSMVFVNDGSTDGTLERIRGLRARDPRVKFVSLSRNFGYHAVLLAGLSSVEADLYAMIDVDCEDPPELIADLHAALRGGADVAYGIRSDRAEPAALIFFRRVFYYVNRWIADSDIVVWMGEFGMITRQVRDAVLVPRTTYPFVRAEIAYAGFGRVGIPYRRGPRVAGRTHYNAYRMAKFAVSAFLASSTFLLRSVLYLAVFAALLFPVAVWALALDPAATAAAAAVAGFYFALFALSTIALYLARTYKNGIARPVFIIDRERTELS